MLYDIFAIMVLYPATIAAIFWSACKLAPVINNLLFILGRCCWEVKNWLLSQ